ncbi:SCO family protein [Aestuariivivens sediminis]|uniref:SCO family protein n=1 Tax=Aestuariivivens sediminis TaxID=2913557 RepID=UPI001F58B868|nr:SCO family protein [Aestuariivivens sediminis]
MNLTNYAWIYSPDRYREPSGYCKGMRMKFTAILLMLFILVSCKHGANETKDVTLKLPYFNTADFTPDWEVAAHKIPQFAFVNQNGGIISNETFKGKIYIADFFFTSCPGICPKLTKNMGKLQDTYADNDTVLLLSHTVMPWKDSIPLLKTYAKKNQVNVKKWHLVTGDKGAIYSIAREGYLADEDFTKTQDESSFIHTENFILVDKEGFIRGVYNGTLEVDVERLKRHVRVLLNEI